MLVLGGTQARIPGRPLRDRDLFFLPRGSPLGDEPLRRRLQPTAVSCSSSYISVGALVDPPVWDKVFFLALRGRPGNMIDEWADLLLT